MMLAVIDVGSNAVRMALGSAGRSSVQIVKSFRAPIRLGSDSFSKGNISNQTVARLIDTFNVFGDIIKQSKVSVTKAVATSAFREAKNKKTLLQRINRESKVHLEVISEKEEARLIHLAVTRDVNLGKKPALIVDIGGGSIEFIFSSNGKIKGFKSLKMGTVRLSHLLVKHPEHKHLEILRKEVRSGIRKLSRHRSFFDCGADKKVLVGTGGNVRTMHRLSKEFFRNPRKESIQYNDFSKMARLISTYSVEERIKELDLRRDRADVILPALVILEETMAMFRFNEIRTPKVGLKDGLLYDIVKKIKSI